MSHRIVTFWAIFVTVAGAAAAQVQAQPAAPAATAQVTADQIDAAIDKGVKFIWSKQQPNGMFGPGEPGKPVAGTAYPGDNEVTAMAALAYAGESLAKPEMRNGLKALMELKLEKTYTLGFRLITLAELYRRSDDDKVRSALRQVMRQDVERLAGYQLHNGGWSYVKTPPNAEWDFSNTQVAILGLQQAVSCGIEIKPDLFIKVMELYLANQKPDGGWAYGLPGHWASEASFGSMTAAAVASLILMRDIVNPGAGCPCAGEHSGGRRLPKVDEAVNRGVQWLGEKYLPARNPGFAAKYATSLDAEHYYYWLYANERVAMATGFKYLGQHNWYADGARELLRLQGPDGSWSKSEYPMGQTAIALLFLIKGRGPVLLNKLQFDGEWDRHPHDAERLAEYVGKLKEQKINWQVINLDVPVEEMHDAPILYLSAETPPKFTDENKKKLRAFTDSGGTILFEASCGNSAVDAAWRKICGDVWPEWELKVIERNHPLWTADARMVANLPALQGSTDGVRTFLFYSPHDISCLWSTQAVARNQSAFDLGSNLYVYASDRGKLRAKLAAREVGVGQKYAGQALAKGPKDAITVARVKHGGDWYVAKNYHPWEFLASQFETPSGTAVPAAGSFTLTLKEAEPLAPGAAIPAGTNILYLSGRTGCELDERGGLWLKAFAAGGGFIFAEAVLGDKRFDEAVRPALQSAGFELKSLPTNHPLLTGDLGGGAKGYDASKVAYSFALRTERLGRPPLLTGLYLGDKLVGVYSPFDIMFSQTGCAAFGNRGYDSADARALATNLVLLLSAGPAAPAGTAAPPTAPTTAMPAP